jgi:2-methylcitrate dehydratase PrpD
MTGAGGEEWRAVAAASQGTTRELARFIAQLRPEGVPEPARRIVRKAFVDAIGCGLHGLTLPWARLVHDFAREQGGPPESTMWAGAGAKVSCLNAALAAGTAVHSFDFDDHARAKIHPGAVVIPAALALAEREGASGEMLATAIAAGYETMIRVSLAANPGSSRMRGWHLTGTTGTFAAAAAASVILGLDAETTASALGLAGTQSAGLWAFNADGAMSKRFHPGRAAQSGLMAALLAQRGYHGPRFILEAPDGGFLAATSDAVRIGEITRDLGSVWRAEDACFKPYSCCGSNHSSIDAALAILAENGLRPADVARVVIGVSRVVETQTGFVYRPTTVLNAQMSLRYDVAVAMLDGQAYLEQFTPARIAEREVCDLASRVDVEVDAEMDAVYPELYAGKVTVETRDGRRITRRVDYSRGMPENPMDESEVRRKFLSLAGAAAGPQQAASLLVEVEAALGGASVRPLAEALGRVRVAT